MRTVKILDQTVEVRALTRGEIKTLQAAGFNLMALTPANAEPAMDAVFELLLSAEQIDYLNGAPYPQVLSLWRAIMAETYGSQDEEKN